MAVKAWQSRHGTTDGHDNQGRQSRQTVKADTKGSRQGSRQGRQAGQTSKASARQTGSRKTCSAIHLDGHDSAIECMMWLVTINSATPAGWYPVQGGQRWWDGHEWTEHFTPALPTPAPVVAQSAGQPHKMVTYQPVRTSHTFHLIMSLLTCGLWAVFVWGPMTLINAMRRKRVVTRIR